MNWEKKIKYLIAAAFSLVFLCLFARDRVMAADVLDDASTGRVILLMGDSYGAGYTPDGMVTGFIEYTKNDLKGVRIESHAWGGEGYSSVGTNRRSVLNCLQDIETWVHDRENVTDIFFVGGAAD